MLFRHVALNQGRSQREVAESVGLPASRIVRLVDKLEDRGWIERQAGTTDRRTNALRLTPAGETALGQIMSLGSEHEADLIGALEPNELSELTRILSKVAAGHRLIEGVHPGFDDSRADQTASGDRTNDLSASG
jgi:DNA-binding MarR family transcriptional regulator